MSSGSGHQPTGSSNTFGSQLNQSTSTPTSGGLFGAPSTSTANASTPTTGGLFGSSSTTTANASAPPSGGLFGSSTTPRANATGPSSLFTRSSAPRLGSTNWGATSRLDESSPVVNASGSAFPPPGSTDTQNKKGYPRLGKSSTEIVRVIVGEEEKVYNLHKVYLTHYSPYFEKALNGEFSEATSNEVVLDHTEPNVFDWFVDWLYNQDLSYVPNQNSVERSTEMIKLWVLGDYLQVPRLQNLVVERLFQPGLTLPPSMYAWVYENTPTGSKLRTLVHDHIADQAGTEGFLRNNEIYCCKDLLVDVGEAMAARIRVPAQATPPTPRSNYLARKYYVD